MTGCREMWVFSVVVVFFRKKRIGSAINVGSILIFLFLHYSHGTFLGRLSFFLVTRTYYFIDARYKLKHYFLLKKTPLYLWFRLYSIRHKDDNTIILNKVKFRDFCNDVEIIFFILNHPLLLNGK